VNGETSQFLIYRCRMPRHANLDAPTRLTLILPKEVRDKLDKYLYNASLGKIPLGAYQTFFVARIQEYFSRGER
jgi:hypothetical protein